MSIYIKSRIAIFPKKLLFIHFFQFLCGMPCILAIESSCDDTGAAVIIDGKIASNIVAGQAVHEAWGGVVPELASRAHQQHILPVVHQALQQANVQLHQLDAIAFTSNPGLIGSLLVGASFAKSLAQSLDIPIMGIHHMEAHIMALFIEEPQPQFPFICLTVSGGHTQLVLMKSHFDKEIIGETIDDAAGEAFDKGAKMLGLPYPGGPLIDQWAQKGNPQAFNLARPQIPELNFSFSGLKTSLLYFLRDHEKENPNFKDEHFADICASYQFAILRHILDKLSKAVLKYKVKSIGIAGGVSANAGLRKMLYEYAEKYKLKLHIPKLEYCTDNAAMIAVLAHYRYQAQLYDTLAISPSAR